MGSYLSGVLIAPEFEDRFTAATRSTRIVGGGVPNFFRKPHGPGWALVGDAGYTKDPITAQGITDAFRSAESCVEAIDQSFAGHRRYEEAMADYQRRRDEAALPLLTTWSAAWPTFRDPWRVPATPRECPHVRGRTTRG